MSDDADSQAFCQTAVHLLGKSSEVQQQTLAVHASAGPARHHAASPNVTAVPGVNHTAQPNRTHVVKEESIHRASHLPPALFSHNTYKSSCDGTAARNLTFMAIGTSKLWWWMGISLIGTAVALGF